MRCCNRQQRSSLLAGKSKVYLITDGNSVVVDDHPDGVLNRIAEAKPPMYLVCLTDQMSRITSKQDRHFQPVPNQAYRSSQKTFRAEGFFLPRADCQRVAATLRITSIGSIGKRSAHPELDTIEGKRDRAILAVLLGCALRRSELAALESRHVQHRDGRWVFVDLVGKGKRIRTVPIPPFVKVAIDECTW